MRCAIFRLEPAGDGSKVLVHTNLTLSGSVAQYGRGVGIIQATATQLMNQFAKCLKEKLAQEGAAAAPTAAASARSRCNRRRRSFRHLPRRQRPSRSPALR